MALDRKQEQPSWTESPRQHKNHSIQNTIYIVLKLRLGNDTIDVVDAVRVLGVLITPDLYVSTRTSPQLARSVKYFQLRQLRRVRRSLDEESVATLVHAFGTSRIDYCNGLLAGAPTAVTDKLQRVMNSAARIVSNS